MKSESSDCPVERVDPYRRVFVTLPGGSMRCAAESRLTVPHVIATRTTAQRRSSSGSLTRTRR
jgi:hypothetical protein